MQDDEGLFGFGLIKTHRRGAPRTEAERAERHERIFGTTALPERGAGLGPLGLGIIPNVQKRISEILR